MIQRCLAILTNALSLVSGGSVDNQYLVGSFSPRGHSISNHSSVRGSALSLSRWAGRTRTAAKRERNFRLDMANYGDWTTFSWNAPSVFCRNRASAQNNIPRMFQLGYVYEVPFGNGRKWATNRRVQGHSGQPAIERLLQCLPGTPVHAECLRGCFEQLNVG